jgi:hypothetical protein
MDGPSQRPARPSRVVTRPEWDFLSAKSFLGTVPCDAVTRMASVWRSNPACNDPRLDQVVGVLDERLRRDAVRFSGVFEPSFSFDQLGWHLCRFSYAFPDFREEPVRGVETILAVARAFGPSIASLVVRLTRGAFQRFVEQPIVGLAFDTPDTWTFKVYYQVDPCHHEEAIGWLGRLVPSSALRRVVGSAPLHLIGMDLGPQGIRAVKLYFLHREFETDRLDRVLWRRPLSHFLRRCGISRMSNLLTIHRLESWDDPGIGHIAAVDFPLIENGLEDAEMFGPDGLLPKVLPEVSPPPCAPQARSRFLFPASADHAAFAVVRVSIYNTQEPRVNLYFHLVDSSEVPRKP